MLGMEEAQIEKYRRAIEQTIAKLPVVDGSVSLESIWLEASLPRDLIAEILQQGKLHLPENVRRIVSQRGRKTLLRCEPVPEAQHP